MRESSAGAFGPVIFWLCTVLAFTVVGVCAQTSGFKCKMLSGYTYDLQKLGSTVKTTHLSYDYTYTPGAPVSCGGAGMTALCEQYSTLIYNSLGQPVSDCSNWQETGEGMGFLLSFRNGGSGILGSNINFSCSTKEVPFAWKSDETSYIMNFAWASPNACPISKPSTGGDDGGGGGLSGGWIFIIILLCLTVVYLVGGVLWNKYRVEKTGWELIPNLEFWITLPGLVKDGNIYTFNKLKALCERFTQGRYETV